MTSEQYKGKKSRIIFDSHIVKIKGEKVVNPRNNCEKEFYTAEFPDWSNIIAFTKDKKVVLVKQFRHGSQRVEVELPGGCVDPGENPLDAAIRELLEETGYSGDTAFLIGSVSPNPAFQSNKCHTSVIQNVVETEKQNLDDGEDIEVFTASLEEVEGMIADGTIRNSMIITAFYFLSKSDFSL